MNKTEATRLTIWRWSVCSILASMVSFAIISSDARSLIGPHLESGTRKRSSFQGGVPVGERTQIDYGGYRPHYQGDGMHSVGGRGGAVYRVTHLLDTTDTRDPAWTGSLRQALTAHEPRIVVFEVSGTVTLDTWIQVTHPFLTIAGQTAPSPGVTVRGAPIEIHTHDVVVQHLRFRSGDRGPAVRDPSLQSAFLIRSGSRNVVLDHNSFSWAVGHNLEVSRRGTPGPLQDLLIVDNIISESLFDSGLQFTGYPLSVGLLLSVNSDGSGTVTGARNLLAHNNHRVPWVAAGWRVSWYNNLAYNAGSFPGDEGVLSFLYYGNIMSDGDCDLLNPKAPVSGVHVANIFLHGPNTLQGLLPVKVRKLPAGSSLYFEGNDGLGMTPEDQWSGVRFNDHCGTQASDYRVEAPPRWYSAMAVGVTPIESVRASVLANAGARPLDRDPVDARIVADVMNGTGGIINSPDEVGGYPYLAENRRALVLPNNPDEVVLGYGRTRIEWWLESLARQLESPTPKIK